jgi:putative FmdB family regulatory protein
MPLFEYLCSKCARKFEVLVGVTAEKASTACPDCGSKQCRKLISRIARTPKSEDDLGDDDLGGPDPGDDLGGMDDMDGYDDLDE